MNAEKWITIFWRAFIFTFKARKTSCNYSFSSEPCKNYSMYLPLAIETRVTEQRLSYFLVCTYLNTNHILSSFPTADITLAGNEQVRSTVSLRSKKLNSRKED